MARRLVMLTSDRAPRTMFEECVRAQIGRLGSGDVLLLGGAPLSEQPAIDTAVGFGARIIEFHASGWRYENGVRVGRWATAESFDAAGNAVSCCRAMSVAARKAHDAGWQVDVLVFTPEGAVVT